MPRDLLAQGQPKDLLAYPEEQPEEGFSAGEMVSNIPGSALRFVDDVTYPARHPIETSKAFSNLVLGVADKAGLDFDEKDQGVYVDAVMQALSDRYGSWDKAAKSLEQDPVGVVSDVIGLVSGGAALAAKGGKTLTNAMHKAAKSIDPNDMDQEVMKFSTTATPAERRAWAQTGLDQGVSTGKKMRGYETKIGDLTDELNRSIDALSTGQEAIPVGRVLAGLEDLKAERGGFKIRGPEDVAAINAARNNFMLKFGGEGTVTPRQMQDFKTDLYEQIDFRRSKQRGEAVDDAIDRDMARQAKEALEETVPEVADINAELSSMLDAKDPLLRAWNRIDNRNKVGLLNTAGAIVGAGAGGAPGAVVGAIAGAVFRPEMKARAAVVLNELIKVGGDTSRLNPDILTGLSVGQVQSLSAAAGRLADEEQGVQ